LAGFFTFSQKNERFLVKILVVSVLRLLKCANIHDTVHDTMHDTPQGGSQFNVCYYLIIGVLWIKYRANFYYFCDKKEAVCLAPLQCQIIISC